MLETESRKCLDKNEEKFWANWTIIQKPEWSRHVEGIPSSWTTNLAGTGRYNLPRWTSTASMKPPKKKHLSFPDIGVTCGLLTWQVCRSYDSFFVHAFTSASFPRKASNISLDFYFLDFIVNNKSQVTNWTARHKAVALKLVQQAAVSSTKINQTQKNTEN